MKAVLALRHALAPGTFDPPGFRLGDCSMQRNLSDEGRAQARRIGAWFSARALLPARVRSSPWCRCVDTATLAFGAPERWAALGSPRSSIDIAADQSHRRRKVYFCLGWGMGNDGKSQQVQYRPARAAWCSKEKS